MNKSQAIIHTATYIHYKNSVVFKTLIPQNEKDEWDEKGYELTFYEAAFQEYLKAL